MSIIADIDIAVSLLLCILKFSLVFLQLFPFFIGKIFILQFLLHVGQPLLGFLLVRSSAGDGLVSGLLSKYPGSRPSRQPQAGLGEADGILDSKQT